MREMPLTQHLEELRKAIIRILFILLFSFVLCYTFGETIAEILLAPLREALDHEEGGRVVYLGILDKVLSQLQVAFWASLLLAAPLWFREVWHFVRPGLYAHEARVIGPFIFLGFILFCLGVLFGYYLVFPLTFQTLLNFGVEDVTATISLKDYLALSSRILFFLGLVFQVPNVLLILGFMGLVTDVGLREKRRTVFVALAVFSAMLTPPDPYTMMGLWIPLVLLFEVGIGALRFIVRPYLERKEKEEV